MKILLTGASGFLGQTILKYIDKEHVKTLGKKNAHYSIDLSSKIPVFNESFELVIHSAGKAHSIPKTDLEGQLFFDVNVIGTLNLLKGLENSSPPKAFVFISSVAVYGIEKGRFITEDFPLLANDPYGKSKVEAEKLILDWCEKNRVVCTILRIPLIVGVNPPGNLKSMIKSIKKGYYFNISGGKAKKSMVLAEDVAKIISIAANVGGIFNLTDGYHPSFSELSSKIAQQLGKTTPLNITIQTAKLMAKIGDLLGSKVPINSMNLIKMTSDLTFDDSKAQQMLGWKPTPVLIGFNMK